MVEQGVLPQGVVGVLDREWFPVGWVAGKACGVGVVEVGQQGCVGPFVGGDVVQQEHDGGGVVGVANDGDAQWCVVGEVEAVCGEPLDLLMDGCAVVVEDVDGGAGVGVQDVLGESCVVFGEHGAQRFVTRHHIGHP